MMAHWYSDLADLLEDDRIAIIARAAAEHIVAFVVEDDAKADRYIGKLAKYSVRVIDRQPGPVAFDHAAGCPRRLGIMVRVGPKES